VENSRFRPIKKVMGSVTNLPGGLAYLTQPGGLLSNLSPAISSALASASPQDLVTLSVAAIQAQQADGLLGVSPPNPGTAGLIPIAGNTNNNSILSLVGAADLTNATSQERAALSEQAVNLQQVEGLFDPVLPTAPNFNLAG
jgi:hypothetical protein